MKEGEFVRLGAKTFWKVGVAMIAHLGSKLKSVVVVSCLWAWLF